MSPVEVIADYLLKLRVAIQANLRKSLGEVVSREESKIQYSFAIPEFSEAVQSAMRSAIFRAGFISQEFDDRLAFIDEPQAIAKCCASSGTLSLRLHDALLVVDCGTGIVSLTPYFVSTEAPLDLLRLGASSSDSCGLVDLIY